MTPLHVLPRGARRAVCLGALALLCASCANTKTAASITDARLGETVVLERGDLARFVDADLAVRFDSVSSDTRCPEDVPCADRGAASAQQLRLDSTLVSHGAGRVGVDRRLRNPG